MKAEYKNGLAFIANGNQLSEVDVKLTAELVLKDRGMRPNKVDMFALAAGYMALLGEADKLRQQVVDVGVIALKDEPRTHRIEELEGQLSHALSNTERAIAQTAEAIEASQALKAKNVELQQALQRVIAPGLLHELEWCLREGHQGERSRKLLHSIQQELELVAQHRCPAFKAGDQHPDDVAVDRFAAAMKAKMAASRAKGRGGWDDPEQCPADRLRAMLRAHISKGDAVDVGNFAMMLHQRGERTTLPLDPALLAALEQANKTGASVAELPNGSVMFINRGEDFSDMPDLNCPTCGGSGHIDDTRPAATAEAYPTAMPEEPELRAEFEKQHAGRNLNQHHLRGTYLAANIAALWNQHRRTAEWMANRQPACRAVQLEPVGGDLLPPIGSKVEIHLASRDAWVEHTVTGYYVWGALSHQIKEGEKNAHRVFVRVVNAAGYPNARLLSEVRQPANGAT